MTREAHTDGAPRYGGLARPFHDAHSEEMVSAFWKRHDVFRRSIEAGTAFTPWGG